MTREERRKFVRNALIELLEGSAAPLDETVEKIVDAWCQERPLVMLTPFEAIQVAAGRHLNCFAANQVNGATVRLFTAAELLNTHRDLCARAEQEPTMTIGLAAALTRPIGIG